MNDLKRCMLFLKKNGFEQLIEVAETPDVVDDYFSFWKKDLVQIDIAKDGSEIVFIDDQGDFLTIPCNYYALIGALMEYHLIAWNYVSNEFQET